MTRSSQLYLDISKIFIEVDCALFFLYADDTQIYFASSSPNSRSTIVLSACLAYIRAWMSANFRKLNVDKTEAILLGWRQRLHYSKDTAHLELCRQHNDPNQTPYTYLTSSGPDSTGYITEWMTSISSILCWNPFILSHLPTSPTSSLPNHPLDWHQPPVRPSHPPPHHRGHAYYTPKLLNTLP